MATANVLLNRLLDASERAAAGLSSRVPAVTEGALADYRSATSLKNKEEFEAVFKAAHADGAISLKWDGDFVKRIELVDAERLAKFLGRPLVRDLLSTAEAAFSTYTATFPALEEVLQRWRQLKTVRALGPESHESWCDAAYAIERIQDRLETDALSLPIREASVLLFKNSKRLERLKPQLEVLLAGTTDEDARESIDAWQELGLFREEQPARLAGYVTIARERLSSLIDAPYIGLSPESIRSIESPISELITIENLTTFHSEAKRRFNDQVLLIYTAGMPSPAWRQMYVRLLNSLSADTRVLHWGDVDEGGFRIAAKLAEEARGAGISLMPWRMSPSDVSSDQQRKASDATIKRMTKYALDAGWERLAEQVREAGIVFEQEAISV